MADLIVRKGEINALDFNLLKQDEGYNVSDRYQAIPTQSIIDIITEQAGPTKIVAFNKVNVRKHDKQGFQRHVVMLELENAKMIDNTSMNIVLYNSNDRSSAVKMFAGSIRAACSNKLVWGDLVMPQMNIKHSLVKWESRVHEMIKEFHKAQETTKDTIDQMMNKYVSYGDIGRFVEQVTEEILEPEILGSILDPLQLNHPHRQEDTGKDVWHLTNRIQYNIIQGGIDRIIQKENNDILFDSKSKTHKVTDTNKIINMNRKLTDMAIKLL